MALEITQDELELLVRNVSNEVVNGFKVEPFTEQVGISNAGFKEITNRLRSTEIGSRVALSDDERRIFRNALAIVIEELGIEEFQTRTGYTYEAGIFLLQKLSQIAF